MSLWQLCCKVEQRLQDEDKVKLNYLDVRKLPDSIRVTNIYNDLLDVSQFLGNKVHKEDPSFFWRH